jgi:hypothetical protein
MDAFVDSEPQPGTDGPPDVRAWRRALLFEAGFAPELARSLAANRGYDLHALLNLVDRGCPPPLAARILAPLELRGHMAAGSTPPASRRTPYQ